VVLFSIQSFKIHLALLHDCLQQTQTRTTLCLLKHYGMNRYRSMEVRVDEFLTLALAGLDVKVQALAVLSPRKPSLVLCAQQVVVTAYLRQPLRIMKSHSEM